MKHALFSFAGAVKALPRGVAIVICGLISLQASAQQPGASAQPPVVTPAPIAQPPDSAPAAGTEASQTANVTNPAQPVAPSPGATASGTVPVAKTAAPDESNPFSNVKPVDDQALKQELPALENRVKQMENQMSAIQQVGAVLPADALGGTTPSRPRVPGQPAPMDDAMMELQASTFVACVNGQALFRDTDQKPFFVDAKEANQNEAVRRIGGCKH